MSRHIQQVLRTGLRSSPSPLRSGWNAAGSSVFRCYTSDTGKKATGGVDPGYGEAKSAPPSEEAKPSSTSDPFPLPFDPRLQGLSLSSEHQSEGLRGDGHIILDGEVPVPLRVPGRELGQETRDVKVARLIYQTRKRGTLETDLLLSTFAKEHLRAMSDEEVDEFDRVSI